MSRRGVVIIGGAMLASAILGAAGALYLHLRPVPTDVPPPPDYASQSAWLCRPGRDDACAKPTTATIFATNGQRHTETSAPDPAAAVDCFYVYPTVSRARAAYAPIALSAAETDVARMQFARFASVCRPFAPLYRQVTRKGLPDLFAGRRGVTIEVPYADVLAAWRAYLSKDNGGRPVVLIGHSQGARLLARLLANELDGKPETAKLALAILPGTTIEVPAGHVVGGTYRQIPLCTPAEPRDCVIAYSTYLAGQALPAEMRFGVAGTAGMRAACVDPAALAGAGRLEADFPAQARITDARDTDFADVRNLVVATCKRDQTHDILAVTAQPVNTAGKEAADFMHDVAAANPAFGLHELDINLALGTLVDLVRREAASYPRR